MYNFNCSQNQLFNLIWHTNKINKQQQLLFHSLYQWTPLHIAARQGHQDIVEYLIGEKASINIEDNDGVSIYDENRLDLLFEMSDV